NLSVTTSPVPGQPFARAVDSPIRLYVVPTSALDLPMPGTRRYLLIKPRSGPEGRAMNLLGGAAPDVIERRERSDRPAAIQVLRACVRHLRAARPPPPHAD